MTVQSQGASAWASGSTTAAPNIPAHVADDLIVAVVHAKPAATGTPPVFSTPAGWTKEFEGNSGTGAAQGVDAGQTWTAVYTKIATSSAETISVSVTNGNVNLSATYVFRSSAGYPLSFAGAIAADTATANPFSLAASLGVAVGDMVGVSSCLAGNNVTYNATWSVSATGITFGAVTKRPATDGSNNTGNDLAASGATANPITAGSGTVTVTWSNTLSAASQTGSGVVFRIREQVPIEHTLPTDAIGGTDSITADLSKNYEITDAAGLTDSGSWNLTSENDAAALTDEITTQVIKNADPITDVAGLTDSIQTAKTIEVTITDTIGGTDSIAPAAVYARTQTDAIGGLDSIAAVKVAEHSLTDNIGGLDAIAPVQTMSRSLTDNIGGLDAIDAARVINAPAITDAIGGIDSIFLERSITITDVVGGLDSTAIAKTMARELTDAAGATDAIVAGLAIVTSLTDGIGGLDAITKVQDHRPTLTDAIGGDDSISSSAATSGSYTITDAIGGTDSITKVVAFARTQTDAIGGLDATSVVKEMARIITDLLGGSDVMAATRIANYEITDLIGASDSHDYAGVVFHFDYDPLIPIAPRTFDEAIRAPSTIVTRRVDIYEQDGTTPYYLDAPLEPGGVVSVDLSRPERRSLDVTLTADDERMVHAPGFLWYDKVFKVFRGVELEREIPYATLVADDGATHHWRLGEPAGALSGLDEIGGASLTYTGTPGLGGGGALSVGDDDGSLYMNNSSLQYASTPDRTSLDLAGATQWTVESWFTTTAAAVGYVLAKRGNGGAGNPSYAIRLDAAGTVFFGMPGVAGVTSTLPYNDGRWHHVVGVYDNGRLELWIDGELMAFSTGIAAPVDTTGSFDIGRGAAGGAGDSFYGGVDEVAVYKGRALLQHEIVEHYDTGIGNHTTEVVHFEKQVGEFLADTINTPHFPAVAKISGRDYTKRLQTSKFTQTTTFASGQALEALIKTIALNGGITKFIFPTTGVVTGKEFTFERGIERIEACTKIAEAYGYEVFFNGEGYMVLREQPDPSTSPMTYTFFTGAGGQLASWNKKTTDTRIYNHIVVVGQATNQATVMAEATNTEPSSPTNIDEIGDRLYQYVSSFISTVAQAQNVADKFLAIHALEQFDLDFASLVIPWLEVGDVIQFIDPNPAPGDPSRFLLSNFNIPLDLTLMNATGRRVTMVG